MSTSMEAKQAQFLLLFRRPDSGPHPTPDDMQRVIERFTEWRESLADKGIALGQNHLADAGTVLRGPRGAMLSDGPYAESKEIVAGYFLIAADSLPDAVEIARDCPGLDYRMTVEVRPVDACPAGPA